MKKVISIAVTFCVAIICSGCSFLGMHFNVVRYTDELHSQYTDINTNRALTWFATNMPEATDITVEVCCNNLTMSANLVAGQYIHNGAEEHYSMNVDTGECITSEAYKIMTQKIAEALTEELPLVPQKIEISDVGYTLSGKTISDIDDKEKHLETPTLGDVGSYKRDSCDELPWNTTDKEYEAYVEQILHTNTRKSIVTITFDTFEGVEEAFKDLEFCIKHSTMRIIIQAERNAGIVEQYTMDILDKTAMLKRFYKGLDGKSQIEIIASKTIE